MKKFIDKIKEEKVTTISFLLALFSVFLIKPDKEYLTYINTKTIVTLYILMLIVAVIKEINLFYIIGSKLVKLVNNIKLIILILTSLCFFSSMFITNDVSLITFVPFTIEILYMINKEKYMIIVIVLETIAANLGSSLTPIGNPQNIYLFSLSNISTIEFINIMLPYVLISFVLIILIIMLIIKNEKAVLNIENTKIEKINIKNVFLGADYFLLLTFIFLFIFIGNISRIDRVNTFLKNIIDNKEIIISVLSSQIISNVPAAILLSKFTNNFKDLIIGTNIGGLGTLIASMASLISYKFYAKTKGAKAGKYILTFTIYNIVLLIILLLINKLFTLNL